jgi:hypothetical protein
MPHLPTTAVRPSTSLTRELKVRPNSSAVKSKRSGPASPTVVRTLELEMAGTEADVLPADTEGSDAAKPPSSPKTSFMAWEKSTFDQDFVVKIVNRMSPHKHLSSRIAAIAQPKVKANPHLTSHREPSGGRAQGQGSCLSSNLSRLRFI